jgi:hypothetical protein
VERVTVAIARRVYLGFEAEFGDLGVRESEPGTRHLVAGGVGLAGLQGGIGSACSASRSRAAGTCSTPTAIPAAAASPACSRRAGDSTCGFGPWVTIGGTLGTSLIDRGAWLAGISFGVHSQSFGGYR